MKRILFLIWLTSLSFLGWAQIQVQSLVKTPTCAGGSTGSISLSVSGGTVPYSYTWSNGMLTKDIASIPAGTYTVQVQDARGIKVNHTVSVSNPPALQLSIEPSKTELCQDETAELFANANGGTGKLAYQWNDAAKQKTAIATALKGGTYTVTVTDSNACSAIQSITLKSYDDIQVSTLLKNDVKCKGDHTGSVSLGISGGKFPYAYEWNTGDSLKDLNGLKAGVYTITVTDAALCQAQHTVSISEPATYFMVSPENVELKNVTCFDGADGYLKINLPNSSLSDYTIKYSNSDTTITYTALPALLNLKADLYVVTITNPDNCAFTTQFEITQPAEIAIDSAILDEDLDHLTVLAKGGSGTLYYSIDGGKSFFDNQGRFDSLSPGEYSLFVKDEKGCERGGRTIVVKSANDMENLSIDADPDFEIYPTPSSGLVTLKVSNKKNEAFAVEVRNVEGKLISRKQYGGSYSVSWLEMDFSSLANGLYLINVHGSSLSYQGKVVIKH